MKNISNLFISISFTILIYILYKDIIYHKGTLNNFYWKYYFITTFLILFSITTYFINKKLKIKLLKILFYLIIFLYIVEGSLSLNQQYHVNKLVDKLENNLDKNNNFDKRTFAEYALEENIKPKNAYISPQVFINEKNLKILPLASKSFTNFFWSNKEFGNYYNWQTDRHGFRNLDDVWDKNDVEAIILGDSFLMPGEINKSISANLIKLINETKKLKKNTESGSVIELAVSGGGTLYEYAIAKEYILNKKVKNLILFFFEANDLTNLQNELKNPILNKYFEQEKFIQNLIYKQNIVDNMYDNSDLVKLEQNIYINGTNSKETKSQKIKRRYKFEWSRFVKLYKLRELTIESKKKKPIEEFKILMKKFKRLSKNNNINFYFVYVPEINRYLKNFEVNESSKYYEEIIEIVKNLELNIIDLNKELYSKVSNPLKYFPLESFGHTTMNTNIAISKIIFEKIYNNQR